MLSHELKYLSTIHKVGYFVISLPDMDDIILQDIVYNGIELEILSPDMIEYEHTSDQLDKIKYLVDV